MNILTFDWHEPYICALARTGHRFDVVERTKGGHAQWFYEMRPLPRNARIIKDRTARQRARDGHYDAVICHNVPDLLWSRGYHVPKILVCHNKLATEIALSRGGIDGPSYRAEVRGLLEASRGLTVVFISDSKRADWDLPGHVITPGIDPAEYGGFHGSDARVLRVGNLMRERDIMLGYSAQLAILARQPSTLLGLNAPPAEGRPSRDWDDLRAHYQSHRVYLNTTVDPYEDGYNLAMLEAMATGMPIVSTANPSSPIVNGVNGYISADHSLLSARISQLLRDQNAAIELGAEAQRTVAQQFHIDDFAAKWDTVIRQASATVRVPRRSASRVTVAPETPVRRKILLAYVSYPATTARYLERSLRKRHDVLTIGPAIGPELIRHWNLENMREPVVPHDIPCGVTVDLESVLPRLPNGWRPDLFLWVESVPGYAPQNVARLDCPTACYLIDSHLNVDHQLGWSCDFDWVFVLHRQYIERFRQAGCSRLAWLPAACDPAIHRHQPLPKRHDVCFVGSPNDARRVRLRQLGERVSVHVERSFLSEMARTFCESRIVFNLAVKEDLNMRVFETLSTGSMLLTDAAPGSGMTDMFGDREHLVVYDEHNLADLAEYYLAHDAEREAIAARGRAEVLRWHTYDHRAAALIDTVFGGEAQAEALTPVRIDDPMLTQALTGGLTSSPAATRAAIASRGSHRELSAVEGLIRDQIDAQCLSREGRYRDAQRRMQAAIAGLAADHRRALTALWTA
ncbi:MAG TPA: glycosyltransferase [Vicinamibacterales bacterium]|nr:glycosyltransferase [Vicinamibacterales bacterium]